MGILSVVENRVLITIASQFVLMYVSIYFIEVTI